MEFKHFSHHHDLVPHHPFRGSEPICSGCKSPASGNVHVCWKCNYFLHEQCFRAQRSINHPFHPLHPLTLVPSPTYPSGSFICNTCHVPGHGFSYTCAACDFDLHLHCALQNVTTHTDPHFHNPVYPTTYPPHQQAPPAGYPPITHQQAPPAGYPPIPHQQAPPAGYPPIPNSPYPDFPTQNVPMIKHFSHPHVLKPMEIEKENQKVCSACECELSGSAYCCTEPHCSFNLHKTCFDSPRELQHKSHLQHPLKLLAEPPYSDGFTCNACLKDGKAFVYTCGACSYDLHVDCVQWPEAVKRVDHSHNLALYYSSPAAEAANDVSFMCDVCKNPVHEMAWVYYCRECDFGTHLECVTTGIKQQGSGKSDEELIKETELKFAVLQLLLEAQGLNQQ